LEDGLDIESVFLRRLLARPDDLVNRLSYADWLRDRGDPRAQLLRLNPDLERIRCAAWLETNGTLDSYLANTPELKLEAEGWRATARQRERRRALGSGVDPDWLAFINSLGCPFQPFFFFNNHGDPHECQPDELPFAESIGTRGSVITFESDFRDEESWGPGLMRDLGFLSKLELDECFSGAATCPVHPFICELKAESRPLSGADVLASLRPRAFRSCYIEALDATSIPYPGYHPSDGKGTHNDEIHNDFDAQYIFKRPKEDRYVVEVTDEYGAPVTLDEDDGTEDIDEWSGTHGELKRFVAGGQLWYVLLHTAPQRAEEFVFSRYAVLLAVGQSPHGDRLLGVVTHQVCHNLCD
jgi:uncharacterized protein (TIGR02996 family)